ILCNNIIDWKTVATHCNLSPDYVQEFFSFSEIKVAELLADGLLQKESYGFSVTKTGAFFSRNIAAAFDPVLVTSNKLFSSSI
ncbi:MAG TPA: hypothetical protein PLU45_03280, partial [Bacteroidales bacterium]|nr:hypothetical protein [Bacteroidales bacterium]